MDTEPTDFAAPTTDAPSKRPSNQAANDAAGAPRAASEETASKRLTRMAAQGLVALLVGLLLLVPLRGAIGSDTYGGYYGWVGVAIVITVVIGFVARLGGVPHALSVAATAAAIYVFCCPLLLFFYAALGSPGSDGEVSASVTLPAAAVAALVTFVVAARIDDALPAFALIACVVGFGVGVSAGEPAWSAVRDAQEAAVDAAEIETSGLSPYLPEIDGLEPKFSSISRTDGMVSGVGLSYVEGGSRFSSTEVYVDITTTEAAECDPELYDCDEGDGYVVISDDGEVRSVVANLDGTALVATYPGSGTATVDPDELGAALADAEESDWVTIAGLG
ncbi:hypothetical protein FXB39_03295 [Nocardioides sp. BGMRC 2183]|nr:hypothetical protein FXB39_03295 [Nocardioides sp. BGMRC 2183]